MTRVDTTMTFETARQVLDAGQALILPTETVWGLAARADSAEGVARIYALKGRDEGKPLAVCVRDRAMAETLAVFSPRARALAEAHWPGPLTLVLPLESEALRPETRAEAGGMTTVALRCPDIDWRDTLCRAPLALTSANRSCERPVADEAEARDVFPTTPVLSSESDMAGAPTTIVRVIGDTVTVLRQGDVWIEATA